MSESAEQRRRRKFLVGVLDQSATTLGGMATGVFTAGVVAPLAALLAGGVASSFGLAILIAAAAALTSLFVAGAVVLKGRSKRLDDDAAQQEGGDLEPKALSSARTDRGA